jgi:hypothetical protein
MREDLTISRFPTFGDLLHYVVVGGPTGVRPDFAGCEGGRPAEMDASITQDEYCTTSYGLKSRGLISVDEQYEPPESS